MLAIIGKALLGLVIYYMIYSLFQLLSLFDIIVILGCSFLYGLPGVRWDLFELVIYPR